MTSTDYDPATNSIAPPPELRALSGEYYVSDEWYQADLDVIFYQQWLLAGHGTEIPNKGDFFTFGVGTENVIIVRQADGSVAAFHNVCRHRGARVCVEDKGNAGRAFSCPYHAWSYGVDGKLLGAPRMPDDFNKADYGLKKVWVEEFHTLIFVSFADEKPSPVSESYADVDLTPWGLDDTKVVKHLDYEIEANWKLVSENFVECYHCTVVHPELCQVYDPTLSVVGTRLRELEHVIPDENVPDTYHEFSVDGFLRQGKKTLSMDGSFAVKRLLGAEGNHPENSGALYSFPNFAIGFNPDYLIVMSWYPTSPTRTRFRNTFIVHKDAEPGRDFDVDELVQLMDITAREDLDICGLQDVVASRAYEPGPYHPDLEIAVINWMKTYHHLHAQARTK
ncbi:aromatic ring-hydroxylating dioxygenase subunit alpha (plasmid) [Rhodococcus opacus]|uniref:aromatic ring-hydroxylating oxygenase subunit alpha n=1 Tax=Rhodococcus opacus TaxID=37919 RepID=UPI0034D2FDC9